MFIDAHAHSMHAECDEEGRPQPPLMMEWRPEYGDPQDLIKEHNENGIERVLVLDPPEVLFELKEVFKDFVVPVPLVNPDKTTPQDIHDLLARGSVGIKFIAPMHSYGDNRYLPLYEAVYEEDAIAIFHTGFLGHGLFEPGGLLGMDDCVDITNMRPSALDRISRALPDLKIIMAHFGMPWWEEAWKMITSCKNIYGDLSGGTAIHKAMDMWVTMFRPNGRLHNASVEKLVFGSDCSYFKPNWTYYRDYIDFHERLFDALDLSEELRTKIARDNILSLIGANASDT